MTRGYKVSLLTALYFAQGLPFGFSAIRRVPLVLRSIGALGSRDRLQSVWRRAAA